MNYTYYRRYKPSPRRSSFKSFFWLVVILVIVLLLLKACVSVASSFLKDKQDEANLALNKGSAQVLQWGQTTPETVASAQLFLVGDTVTTGENSIVTLTFTNGSTVVLDSNSKMTFAEATMDDTAETLHVDLLAGRAFVKQTPEDGDLTLELHTNVMNISSLSASYLVSNADTKEYVYGFDGEAKVSFVDRSQQDSVIDTITLEKGKKSVLTADDEKNLLARQSITLIADAGDDLIGDAFVAYNKGEAAPTDIGVDPALPTIEAANTDADASDTVDDPTTETPTPTTPVSSLQISVTSPGLNSTIQKDAIAIEGAIVAGTADHVTITWDGNGTPYTLAGFKAGGSNFRYVADATYKNLKAGVNTYTVIAYAADGTVSNTVTVVITAEF